MKNQFMLWVQAVLACTFPRLPLQTCANMPGGRLVGRKYTMSMELASLASYPDARCNDGSNAGYYFLPAPSNSSRDWLVMLDSGGWCWDETSCHARCAADASRCSSLLWSDVHNASGILASTQLRLANAHKVYVPYCTSDAHMGNAVAYGMQFRGAVVVRTLTLTLT